MKRKIEIATGETYHIFNKTIAGFKIFNKTSEYQRIQRLLKYYQIENMPIKFSQFIMSDKVIKSGFYTHFHSVTAGKNKLVQIIAYCIMPTHFHLILKELMKNGISFFVGNIQNSYSHYYNTKTTRKGPLWEGKFQNRLVKTDEQLLHLTRYIHLNPVTAFLVDKPEDWAATSYHEYLLKVKNDKRICEYGELLDIKPNKYRNFVEDRISYQRELAKIKDLLLD